MARSVRPAPTAHKARVAATRGALARAVPDGVKAPPSVVGGGGRGLAPAPEATMDDALYRQIVEGSPDAIILGDREGRIRLWNPAAAAMFGFSAAEAVGASMDLIIPERLRGRHWEGYRRVMASGESRYGAGDLLAVPAVTKDGRTLSIEFTIQMLRAPGGELVGTVAVIRDVTKRFQRDREAARRLKELEARVAATGG
jgi:PAS domain S-box-containing protein